MLHSQIGVEAMAVVVADGYNLVMVEVTAVAEVVIRNSIEAVETIVAVMMVHHN